LSNQVTKEKIMTKPTYEAPTVAVLGSFEEMTKATTQGQNLDQTLPVGTPLSTVLQSLS
jgi:hypothetical protein